MTPIPSRRQYGRHLVFDLAVDQRVSRLQRSNGSQGLRAAQLLDIEVGNPNPAHFTLPLQGGKR